MRRLGLIGTMLAFSACSERADPASIESKETPDPAWEWVDLEGEYEAGGYEAVDLLRRVLAFKDRQPALSGELLERVDHVAEELGREAAMLKQVAGDVGRYMIFYRSTVRPFEVAGEWSKAIDALDAFIAKDPHAAAALQAQKRRGQVEVAAYTEWTHDLRRQAGRLCRQGKKAEAVELLSGRLDDFRGTATYDDPKGIKALHEWLKTRNDVGDFFK